jgi:hypothetical protein
MFRCHVVPLCSDPPLEPAAPELRLDFVFRRGDSSFAGFVVAPHNPSGCQVRRADTVAAATLAAPL